VLLLVLVSVLLFFVFRYLGGSVLIIFLVFCVVIFLFFGILVGPCCSSF
jgi:hypothetical protein